MEYSLYTASKRGADIVISSVLLVFLLPIFFIIAVLIRLESRGPIFFRQPRVGRNRAPFRIVKFRSMVENAAAAGPYWTATNDARITRIGKLIRATSIDELPQLWNVLVGEMSLIGPRPDTPAQEALCTPHAWEARHAVRPGITGLAQVNGRSTITPEDRLAFDLAYAADCSWRMDANIILKTIAQVLRKVGVN